MCARRKIFVSHIGFGKVVFEAKANLACRQPSRSIRDNTLKVAVIFLGVGANHSYTIARFLHSGCSLDQPSSKHLIVRNCLKGA